MSRNRVYLFAILSAAIAAPASADVLSNASLNGAYYFRYIGALTDPADSARSFQGTITFDGNGKYAVTGQGAAAVVGGLKPLTGGSYLVVSSGLFSMTNPVDPTGNAFLYGGIGNGAVVA